MDAVVTGAWRYAFISNLPKLLPFLALGCLIPAVSPLVHGWSRKIVLALILAAVFLGVRLLALSLFQPLLQHFAYLAHDEIYKPPYDWHVDLPSYLSFSEPVLAGFVVAFLVWDRLSGHFALKVCQFATLVMAMDRDLLGPLVYALTKPQHPVFAVISFGQFWLQDLVQAILTGFIWALFERSREVA